MNGTDCFFSALDMLISFLPDGESPSCLWFQHSLQLILMHDPEIHSQQKYGCQDPSHRTCHTDSKEALIMGCCKRRPASSDQFSDSGGHGKDAVFTGILIFFAGKYMTVLFVSENVRQLMSLVDVSLRCAAVSFVFLAVVNIYRNGTYGMGSD